LNSNTDNTGNNEVPILVNRLSPQIQNRSVMADIG